MAPLTLEQSPLLQLPLQPRRAPAQAHFHGPMTPRTWRALNSRPCYSCPCNRGALLLKPIFTFGPMTPLTWKALNKYSAWYSHPRYSHPRYSHSRCSRPCYSRPRIYSCAHLLKPILPSRAHLEGLEQVLVLVQLGAVQRGGQELCGQAGMQAAVLLRLEDSSEARACLYASGAAAK